MRRKAVVITSDDLAARIKNDSHADLLVACKSVLAGLECDRNFYVSDNMRAILRIALAKARGDAVTTFPERLEKCE